MVLAIILLTALINIVLGVVSYNNNPRSVSHRLLTGLTIIFALWTVANYFSLNSATKEETLFWIRAVMLITAPMGPVLYLFVKAFPHSQLSINKKFLKGLIALILLVQILSFSPLLFSDVLISNGTIAPVPGPGVILYGLLLVGASIAGFWELIRKYIRSHGIERLQLKYLIVGITETFALMIITNFIAVVVFKYSGFVIFGPIFSLILVGFITYSIIRHRLLEVRIIVARSVVYALLIIVIAVLYTAGVFLVSHYLFKLDIDIQELETHALLALFVAFTFVPLRNYIEKATDRIFFKGKYNANTLVLQLTKIVASTINLEELTHKTLQKLLSTLRITHGAFIIYKNRNFTVYSEGHGYYEDRRKAVDELYNLKRMVIFDEEKNKRVKELMRTLDVVIVLPLFERGDKQGILFLGEKKSGQIYSQQDISVLDIFEPAISVAIQNAKSYEAIRKFNTTLKKEVQVATKDLQLANIKLRELGRQKDDFIAIASHELKTPVTSIKLYTQLLHRKFQKQNDIQSADAVAKMDTQVNKLTALINDLLDVTKIEEGKLRLNFETFDFNDLTAEIVEEMQLTTKHKIEKHLGSVNPIDGDRDRIGQVLVNFISNAIKYSPGANKVIVKTASDKKNIVISVQDFGMGLTPKDQLKVFERFNRAGQEGPGGLPGLGLGLYISKEIIKRHKGEIWLESKKGRGSTFYFSLPIKTKTAN